MKVNQHPIILKSYFGREVSTGADITVPLSADKKTEFEHFQLGPRGFGVDLNGDGKVDAQNDGFLAFPTAEGKYDVSRANELLKAFAGDLDLDADGTVSDAEKARAAELKTQGGALDLDRDGVLSSWELQKAGAAVVRVGQGKDGETELELRGLPGTQGPNEAEQLEIAMIQQQQTQMMMMYQFHQNAMLMQQSFMMTPLVNGNFGFTGGFGMPYGMGGPGGLAGFGGDTFGGYPMGLALPIY